MRSFKGTESECPLLRRFNFRHLDPFHDKWAEIDHYNKAIAPSLPLGARTLALAEWHYNASDPRCPHDSWLQSIEILTENSKVIQGVRLRLLGPYHDQVIRVDYANVTDFSVQGQLVAGNRNLDWLYDEVHLCDAGSVEHLIEFEACVVRIECADLVVTHIPIPEVRSLGGNELADSF